MNRTMSDFNSIHIVFDIMANYNSLSHSHHQLYLLFIQLQTGKKNKAQVCSWIMKGIVNCVWVCVCLCLCVHLCGCEFFFFCIDISSWEIEFCVLNGNLYWSIVKFMYYLLCLCICYKLSAIEREFGLLL